jgi:hypothetical protein
MLEDKVMGKLIEVVRRNFAFGKKNRSCPISGCEDMTPDAALAACCYYACEVLFLDVPEVAEALKIDKIDVIGHLEKHKHLSPEKGKNRYSVKIGLIRNGMRL